MEEKNSKVLVVDDEKDIRNLLKIYLRKLGCSVMEAENGVQAVELVQENEDIDLVIMDIMMPEMLGTEACNEIRKFSSVPVLFLTAKTKEPDRDEAYEIGGDDFLAKPFNQNEFNRKVSALLRRYTVYKGKSEQTNSQTIDIGEIHIDCFNRVVSAGGENIRITDKEYALLYFLASNRGKPWSLEQIYENIWNEKFLPASSNTVMVHVLRLRQKLEAATGRPDVIKTIYGKGYQID